MFGVVVEKYRDLTPRRRETRQSHPDTRSLTTRSPPQTTSSASYSAKSKKGPRGRVKEEQNQSLGVEKERAKLKRKAKEIEKRKDELEQREEELREREKHLKLEEAQVKPELLTLSLLLFNMDRSLISISNNINNSMRPLHNPHQTNFFHICTMQPLPHNNLTFPCRTHRTKRSPTFHPLKHSLLINVMLLLRISLSSLIPLPLRNTLMCHLESLLHPHPHPHHPLLQASRVLRGTGTRRWRRARHCIRSSVFLAPVRSTLSGFPWSPLSFCLAFFFMVFLPFKREDQMDFIYFMVRVQRDNQRVRANTIYAFPFTCPKKRVTRKSNRFSHFFLSESNF